MIAGAPEAVRDLFSKRVKLMFASDERLESGAQGRECGRFFRPDPSGGQYFPDKGRFVSHGKHILVDEFQDILRDSEPSRVGRATSAE